MEDRLHVLVRLRRVALDEARQAFGEALAAEDAARRAMDAIEDAIEHETKRATDGDDHDVQMFAIWLRQANARRRAAETRVAEAEAASAHKRADVTLVRAALEATETALAERARQKFKQRERVTQRELDEVGATKAR